MTIIPLYFKIERNPQSGKKIYIDLKTGETLAEPKINWNGVPKGNKKLTPSYAIRPDDDLIVLDCDSLEATQTIDDITPYNPMKNFPRLRV